MKEILTLGVILGNILSFCATITDSISGSMKTRGKMIGVQTISQLFYGASAFVLKGYSALVQNVIAIFRNIFVISEKKSRMLEWIFLALGVVFGIYFNNLGVMGLLPVLANLEYTIAMFKFEDKLIPVKIAFLINTVLFAIFNIAIYNFIGFICNVAVAVSLVLYLVRNRKSSERPFLEDN